MNSAAPIAPTAPIPIRRASRAPGTLNRAAIAGPGAIPRPACRMSSLHGPVRNRTLESSMAPKPAEKMTAATTAVVNDRTRSSAGSATGAGWCAQRHATTAMSPAAAANAPTTQGSPQPHSGPSTMPPTSAPTPAASSTAPHASGRTLAGSRASRGTRAPTRSAAIPIGTLTMNTQRQLSSTSSPPIGGPAAAAIPLTAAQPATTTDRFSGGNSGSSSASEVGSSSAAPAAWSTRSATSSSTERVGPAAGGHEQRSQDDRVRVEDPAQRAEVGAGERARQLREGDVDDEEVETAHERAEADDDHREARPLRHAMHISACVVSRNLLSVP